MLYPFGEYITRLSLMIVIIPDLIMISSCFMASDGICRRLAKGRLQLAADGVQARRFNAKNDEQCHCADMSSA